MRVQIFDDMSRCTEAEVVRMLPLVSAQRREQALRYKHTLGRFCCLKSWLMLKELSDGTDSEWRYNEHGKPYWADGKRCFSISHCKEGIAVAVADEEIGIDIEAVRHADDTLIERTMNAAERELINGDARVFTRLWTQKEAVLKAIGTGISGFEQLQNVLAENTAYEVQTIEKEKYIYSIAHGKLHCFGAQVQAADL